MDTRLRQFLDELYEFGRRNDEKETDRAKRMLNITPETGVFLRSLIVAGDFKRVLELGTSNGYSTLWLADAARQIGGSVTTIERNPEKHSQALDNLRRAQLEAFVDARVGDIRYLLPQMRGVDLLFLDSERADYVGWWEQLQAAVRPRGLLVADNATSHPQEIAEFIRLVQDTPGFTSVLLPLGNGELMVLKED